jgi:hypothetical protein
VSYNFLSKVSVIGKMCRLASLVFLGLKQNLGFYRFKDDLTCIGKVCISNLGWDTGCSDDFFGRPIISNSSVESQVHFLANAQFYQCCCTVFIYQYQDIQLYTKFEHGHPIPHISQFICPLSSLLVSRGSEIGIVTRLRAVRSWIQVAAEVRGLSVL